MITDNIFDLEANILLFIFNRHIKERTATSMVDVREYCVDTLSEGKVDVNVDYPVSRLKQKGIIHETFKTPNVFYISARGSTLLEHVSKGDIYSIKPTDIANALIDFNDADYVRYFKSSSNQASIL